MKYFFLLGIILGFLHGQDPVLVRIETFPPQAEVILDGKLISEDSFPSLPVESGAHTFQLQKKGFAPLKWQFDLPDAKTAEITFRMNPLHDLQFRTKEKGLHFKINYSVAWSKRNVKFSVEEGKHTIIVYRGDVGIDTLDVEIHEPTRIIYSLEQE